MTCQSETGNNSESITVPDSSNDWTFDGFYHSRLNVTVGKMSTVQISASLRTRLLFGESVEQNTFLKDVLEKDGGVVDLTRNILSEKSYLLNSSIDRMSFDITGGKYMIRIGRQRINWGMNLTWNPNDLFNARSVMDYEYEEGPSRCVILSIVHRKYIRPSDRA
jgi:hypothetical protein